MKKEEKPQEIKNEKKKKGKGKKNTTQNNPEGEEDFPAKDTKKDKKAIKEQKKKAKEEKKKKKKEVIEVLDEIEDDTRINRVGASVIVVFLGIVATLLIIGSNIFSYNLSIKNATKYFEHQRYTEAFAEVYGLEIKDEDYEIYDKIKTVMFVNKQLNSYNSFYAINNYQKALDALLKGLQRYDKYLELATFYGVKSDFDYVREQILAELNNVFSVSEKGALYLISINDEAAYSMKIYDIVSENIPVFSRRADNDD